MFEFEDCVSEIVAMVTRGDYSDDVARRLRFLAATGRHDPQELWKAVQEALKHDASNDRRG